MSDGTRQPSSETDSVARWQYLIVWRYGALLMIVVGLGLIASALAGVTAVSPDALLPAGLASLLSGVVLPRVKDRFDGPGKVGANLLAPHLLDKRPPAYRYIAPSLPSNSAPPTVAETPTNATPPATSTDVTAKADSDSGHFDESGSVRVITTADVIRALRRSPDVVVMIDPNGADEYHGPDGSILELVSPNARPITNEMAMPADLTLLNIVERWGVQPQATGIPTAT